MSAKHTPGPWRASPTEHGPIDIFDPRERDIVTLYGGGVGKEYQEANARLIAAAPDMLAALKALHERYVFAIGNEGPEALMARAAIAKAEGV